ncbi:MAG: S1 RNA-binding domain-containing protein, partial [Salinibacter sp.]
MAEQEQVAPKDESQDTTNSNSSATEAEATEDSGETESSAPTEATPAPDAEEAPAPAAGEEDAGSAPAASEGPTGEDEEAPPEPSDEPGFVSRILEEAVEEASRDLDIPSGDETTVDVSDIDEPTRTVSPDELERTEEDQGFTGETYGQTVSLDELETEKRSHADDPVYDRFRQVVDETSIDVREQDIVEGRVLQINEDYVVIDIGYKSDGIVPRDEFEGEDISPGDTVEVYLERKEDRDGQLVLSKKQADKVRRWQRVEEIYENEEVVEGTIVRRIKGGMIVELFDGMEAFLPGSQIDVRPVR